MNDAGNPTVPPVEIVQPGFARFLQGNAGLVQLADGMKWTEGPLWMGDWGVFLFQDLPSDRTLAWSPEGLRVWRSPSHYGNGQARDTEGRVVACSHRARALFRIERDGAETLLVDRHDGRRLNAPNDVVAHPDGSIWFTDPLYGIQSDYEGGRQESEQPPAVYRLDPGGALTVLADDFAGPNGIAFAPGHDRVYICETGDQTGADPVQHIRVFDIEGEGTATRLASGRVFHEISPGYSDGLAADEEGYVWSSAADGVHCLTPDGELFGKVRVPRTVSNVAFGDRFRNRLFICASDRVYAIHLNRRGMPLP